MKTVADTLATRLQTLMGDVDFRSDYDLALDSPEHLLAIGVHNLHEYERIEALDDHQERIKDLISNILSSVLQEEAIANYGNTDGSSIQKVLCGWFNQQEDYIFNNRLRQTVEQALFILDLTDDQAMAVLENIYDNLPQAIMTYIEELVTPICMLPRSEAGSIAMVLKDMMEEGARC